MDRNTLCSAPVCRWPDVALRKESVDRNVITRQPSIQKQLVALRKESVDRNDTDVGIPNANTESLSARRAWIEIR